ncbi:MFS transporter [Gordonia sp. NPDC003429]
MQIGSPTWRRVVDVPDRPEWVSRSPRSYWYSVAGISFGALMVQLDSSIVTLALPALQRSFDASLASAQWVSVAYVLAVVSLVTPCARLGDGLGRKSLYIYGYAIFTIGSLACSIAPNLLSLIIFRVVQGIGGAAIAGNAIAMVTESMPKAKLRDGLAVQASMQALGLALGPLIGGLLVDDFGWRSIFWVNVPIGVAALASAFVLLPAPKTDDGTSRRPTMPRFDGPGTILLAAAAITLMLGLSGVSGLPMSLPLALVLLVAPLAIVSGFWVRENHYDTPLIDPRLIRTPQISIGVVGALVSYLLLIAPIVLVPQLLVPLGRSVSSTGVILSSMPAGFLISTVIGTTALRGAGTNASRALLGCALIVGSLITMALHPIEIGWLVPCLAILGVGLGTFVPANNAGVMAAANAAGTGTAGSLIAIFRNTGVATGVAVITLTLHLAQHDSRRDASDTGGLNHANLVRGAELSWWVLVVFGVVAAAVTITITLLGRNRSRS